MYRQFAAADDDNFRIPVGLEPKNQASVFPKRVQEIRSMKQLRNIPAII